MCSTHRLKAHLNVHAWKPNRAVDGEDGFHKRQHCIPEPSASCRPTANTSACTAFSCTFTNAWAASNSCNDCMWLGRTPVLPMRNRGLATESHIERAWEGSTEVGISITAAVAGEAERRTSENYASQLRTCLLTNAASRSLDCILQRAWNWRKGACSKPVSHAGHAKSPRCKLDCGMWYEHLVCSKTSKTSMWCEHLMCSETSC